MACEMFRMAWPVQLVARCFWGFPRRHRGWFAIAVCMWGRFLVERQTFWKKASLQYTQSDYPCTFPWVELLHHYMRVCLVSTHDDDASLFGEQPMMTYCFTAHGKQLLRRWCPGRRPQIATHRESVERRLQIATHRLSVFWGHLGSSWATLGLSSAILWPSWVHLRVIICYRQR